MKEPPDMVIQDEPTEDLMELVRHYAQATPKFKIKTVDAACDWLWVTSIFMQMIAEELERRHGYSRRVRKP